jgi:hypothetical protein
VSFSVFTGSDAGMSHYHDITGYRTVHDGQCWSLEASINSTALGVYDPALGLKPFNKARVRAILDRMVQSFRFTSAR